MQRLLCIIGCFLLLISCKQQAGETANEATEGVAITTEKWPKRSPIDSKAQAILGSWAEYQALETSFDALYTVENREDLNLVVEGLIETEKALEESNYPEKFAIPQVKGRQKMFKTFVLKIQGDLYYRLDTETSVVEMVNAYNSFRNQFNIIVNNTLDTKLILDE